MGCRAAQCCSWRHGVWAWAHSGIAYPGWVHAGSRRVQHFSKLICERPTGCCVATPIALRRRHPPPYSWLQPSPPCCCNGQTDSMTPRGAAPVPTGLHQPRSVAWRPHLVGSQCGHACATALQVRPAWQSGIRQTSSSTSEAGHLILYIICCAGAFVRAGVLLRLTATGFQPGCWGPGPLHVRHA